MSIAGLSASAAASRVREERLAILDALLDYEHDPLGFVLDWFPWGVPGYGLEHHKIDDWQFAVLRDLGAGLLDISTAIRIAVASGHGIGKSALVAWIILWAIVTKEDTKGVVTANTENQLRTKTWAELKKWFRLLAWRFKGHKLFVFRPTCIQSTDPEHKETWRIDQTPWSENNLEAFAGLHNEGKRILVVFDEASAIPDIVHETTEGALTDANTEIIWCMFGNPTRNTGRFREAFGKFRHRWKCRQVDSRTVTITNKRQLDEWVADYGEDSDFVRVRVRGVFPRAGSMQFIPGDLVEAASKREAISYLNDALVIGVDVARSLTEDQTVIKPRKGRDARTWPAIKLRTRDTMLIASRVAQAARELGAEAIFVDGGGVGGGVVDRLRQLKVPDVFEINFGNPPDRAVAATGAGERRKVANKAAEMWSSLLDWLPGGAIENDPELIADLTGREYGYDANDAIVLERKKDMRKRGLPSPDNADALALTFAYPVEASATAGGPHAAAGRAAVAVGTNDHDPYDN